MKEWMNEWMNDWLTVVSQEILVQSRSIHSSDQQYISNKQHTHTHKGFGSIQPIYNKHKDKNIAKIIFS